MARVARFYGWTHDYIRRLPFSVFRDYLNAIPAIEAHEQLTAINVSSFPHTKKEYRKKLIQNLKNTIRNTIKRKRNQLKSIDEINESIKKQLFKGLSRG